MTQKNSKKTVKKGFANEDQKKNINKNGRPPKSEAITDILKDYLEETEGKSKKERKKILIEKIYELAIKNGDLAAIKYIIDRIDGKPKEKKEVDLNADMDLNIIINGE